MQVYFRYQSENNHTDSNCHVAHRLCAYFTFGTGYYCTTFNMPDVYTEEEMQQQVDYLTSDMEAFEGDLRDYVVISICTNCKVYSSDYYIAKDNHWFKYEIKMNLVDYMLVVKNMVETSV